MTADSPSDLLSALALNPELLGPDDDDELLGAALLASWPHAISSSAALAIAHMPKRRNLLGTYRAFLGQLAQALTDEDLPAALDWLARLGEAADDERVDDLFPGVMRLVVQHLDDEHCLALVAEIARRRGLHSQSLFGDYSVITPADVIPVEGRRRLALRLLADVASDDLTYSIAEFGTGHGLGLLGPTDVVWLIDVYVAEPGPVRPAIARLFQWLFRDDDASHVSAI